jgi:hypothetical protein
VSFRLIDNSNEQNGQVSKSTKKKTDICLFYRHDIAAEMVIVGGIMIESKKKINVLGVTFDSKMQWSSHVSKSDCKSKQST